MTQTIGIVGLGLIGGSFARTIRARTDARILGRDICDETQAAAQAEGVIDDRLTREGLAACDILILALRPEDAIAWMRAHIDDIRDNCLVLDVAGVKREVCATLGALCEDAGCRFVGFHPMAGYHKGGFAHSSDMLFEGASAIICEDEYTDPAASTCVAELMRSLGFGQVVVTTPEHHDEVIAFTSQLAHLVSNAYIKDPRAIQYDGFSAGSFHDMTRVATLDADMWTELFLANRDNLVSHLDALVAHLADYRMALVAEDADVLRELLEAGVCAKDASVRASLCRHDDEDDGNDGGSDNANGRSGS
ncbi:MAG: prephenate dehydrogenase/arogenate dehydrogenase family protein [Coriobacteriia bacterium]|nr:prephenate dehydrogenase/arogenate dehydrogenase family protein [Coriobacteriia bacterium]